METELEITGIGLALYSARGLTQTFEPIGAAANVRRTINGELRDVAMLQFRKYRSTITGNDQRPPAFDGKWPGLTVTVKCIARLTRATATAANRTVVPDSEIVEGSYTTYRPQLTMKVLTFNTTTDEYGAVVGWSMDLEEV